MPASEEKKNVPVTSSLSFSNHFWSCDRRGMDQLLEQIRSAYTALDDIHALYKERAMLELEFGQRLQELVPQKDNSPANPLKSMYQELRKTGQSHIDFSNRLENDVATDVAAWITEHRNMLSKLSNTLEDIYQKRQTAIVNLLQVRHNTAHRTDAEYRSAYATTDGAIREWNAAWLDACQQLESLELERVEFVTNNVWRYANLCSARLLVQDEWCEGIRTDLEQIDFDNERRRYVEEHGTGSVIPSTSEYIDYFSKPFDIMNKQLPPRPSGTQPQIRRKPVGSGALGSPTPSELTSLEQLLKKFENGKPANDTVSKPNATNDSTGSRSRPPAQASQTKGAYTTQSTKTLQSVPAPAPAPAPTPVQDQSPSQTPPLQHRPPLNVQHATPKSPRLQHQTPLTQPKQSAYISSTTSHVQQRQPSPPKSPQVQHQAQPKQSSPPRSPHIPHSTLLHQQPSQPQQTVQQQPLKSPRMQLEPLQIPPASGSWSSHGPGPQYAPPSPHHMAPVMPAPSGNSYMSPASPYMPPSSPYMAPSSPYMPPSSPYVPPASPYAPQIPHYPYGQYLPDGRPILYWAYAKYDYVAEDPGEITFKRNNVFAVTDCSRDDGWWGAELWDETTQQSIASGFIPSNYISFFH